jgi:hypothetical protein
MPERMKAVTRRESWLIGGEEVQRVSRKAAERLETLLSAVGAR